MLDKRILFSILYTNNKRGTINQRRTKMTAEAAINWMDRNGITAAAVEIIKSGKSIDEAVNSTLTHHMTVMAEMAIAETDRAKTEIEKMKRFVFAANALTH